MGSIKKKTEMEMTGFISKQPQSGAGDVTAVTKIYTVHLLGLGGRTVLWCTSALKYGDGV